MESKINKTILKIYEAVNEPELWNDVLNDTSDLMHGGAMHLFVFDTRNDVVDLNFSTRVSSEMQDVYVRDYLGDDVRVDRLPMQPIGKIVYQHMLFSEQELRTAPVYNEFLPQFELANLTGSNLSIGNHLVWFGAARGKIEKPYTEEELDSFLLLMPHIRKALRQHLELRDLKWQRGALSRIFDADCRSVFLIDRNAKIAFANRNANEITTELVTQRHGKLCFSDTNANAKLRHALGRLFLIETSLASYQDTFIVTNPSDGTDYGVRVFRYLGDIADWQRSTGDFAVVTLIRLNNMPAPRAEDVRSFGDLYGLTEAEKNIVLALANAIGMAEYAQNKAIKIDTARKQLKSAMSKMHLRSQKDLIRVLERYCFLNVQ